MVDWKFLIMLLNRDLFSHNSNVNDLYVCRFIKTNFANRYVAKYISTYTLTSLFLPAGVLKKKENNSYKHTIAQEW